MIRSTLSLLAAALLATGVAAQSASPFPPAQPTGRAWATQTHSLTGQVGIGWYAVLPKDNFVGFGDTETDEDYLYAASASPAFTLAYEYRVGRSFSIGGAVAHQTNRLTDFRTFSLEQSGQVPIDGEARVGRTFISARTLWHYGRAANVEFYSGLRFGATFYDGTTSGEIASEDLTLLGVLDANGSAVLPHLTVIPLGVKGYLGSNLYIGGELMFGSPHFAAVQVGYRF